MPSFGPIDRKELIRCLKRLGFFGSYSGEKHQLMIKGDITLRLPNPHQSDIGKELLARILRQTKISRDKWEKI